MKASEIRRQFLSYFEERGHVVVPSSSVVPHGDPTLLFTNAGMNQFKEVFTGKVKSKFPRATTAQKCIRAGGKHNDLDNVGYTTRHLTFFEMLGNFSFGDYFKEGAIEFAWELVVERLGLSPDRLWVTVFHEDAESRKIWRRVTGLPEERVVDMGEKDNYWSMGDVGPCGPCSEILFDRGDAFGPADVDNGERFFEIWNLVFMQFDQKPGGDKEPLPRPSIDTGMGLERVAMILQDVDSAYGIDLFTALIQRIEEITGVPYDAGPEGVPHRVLADHIRSLVFALGDGAQPSNEGSGYVLRRILRRAARYGRKIYTGGPILEHLVDVVVDTMGEDYPEIRQNSALIARLVSNEEERFGETLDTGIELFEETAKRLAKAGKKRIPGADLFKLYDTFGFPVDLVERMADEIGFQVDLEGFEQRMADQRERSRGSTQFASQVNSLAGWGDDLPETRFCGYASMQGEGEIVAAREVDSTWQILLSDSPFYAEAGGQVGDTGWIESDTFRLRVIDTQKEGGRIVHLAKFVSGDAGDLIRGVPARGVVDRDRRRAIQRNHSATHLLHAALRQVAGDHVRQKGSLVADERLRFDVTHFNAFTPEELEKAEDLVREKILDDLPVETFETDYEDAVKRGAMALFGEKYGDAVRVVQMGDFSMELCGGTHVARTGEIGPFLIAAEGSVSSGVRRVEALTAATAEALHRSNSERLRDIAAALKVQPAAVLERVEKLLTENRDLKQKLKAGATAGAQESGDVRRESVGDALFVGAILPEVDGKGLRDQYDRLKKESSRLVALLIGTAGGRLGVLMAVSQALVDEGVDARELFKAPGGVLGARGGGRPQMVQAGGRFEEAKLAPAVDAAYQAVLQRLGG